MVERWKKEPRWTTAHKIYIDVMRHAAIHDCDNCHDEEDECTLCDGVAAHDLAWQVFFQLYVMPYELKKREENGDI
jgi:hypothetical protein